MNTQEFNEALKKLYFCAISLTILFLMLVISCNKRKNNGVIGRFGFEFLLGFCNHARTGTLVNFYPPKANGSRFFNFLNYADV